MNVFDVAKYFLTKESMTNKKLQKLCYYAQAWYITLYNEKLFPERIEAWVHGPVCPKLYGKYSSYGYLEIPKETEISKELKTKEKNILDQVWNIYGKYDGNQLEVLTHRENPWIDARHGIDSEVPSNEEITADSIKKYYKEMYNL